MSTRLRGSTRRARRPGPGFRRTLMAAAQEATAAGHTGVGSEHLLLALVSVGGGRGALWLRRRGLDAAGLRSTVRRAVDDRGGDPGGVARHDLAVFGLQDIDVPVGGAPSRPGGRRGRPGYTEEARVVLTLAAHRAQMRPGSRRSRRRSPVEDDLAAALATARGTRARDLLRHLGVDPIELRDAAG